MGCAVKEFPCSYLGLPLSIRRPSKKVFLPLIDKVANHLLNWKASLMNRAGRLVLVRAVLTATPIHMMIALDLPKWVIKAIDKRRRGFLWCGQKNAHGGNCLVSWRRCKGLWNTGGLGIHNLDSLGCALRIRWLWAQKTDPTRPWVRFPVQVSHKAQAMFDASVVSIVGDGGSILFWSDRWLNGRKIQELAPNLHKLIPKRTVRTRTVSQALVNRTWVHDIKGSLTVQVLAEYLRLWDQVDSVELQQNVPDSQLTQSGNYSSKSAYDAFFLGSIQFGHWK